MTSFMIAIAVIIIFYKVGVMRWVRGSATADAAIDTTTTIALAVLFSGTFIGLVTGFFAGIIISAWLTVSRLINRPRSRLRGSNWTYFK